MAGSKIRHFKRFSIVDGDIKVKLDMSRFEKQFKKAQYQLDGNVMNSMIPFMPKISGIFINVTKAASATVQGSGKVYAAYSQQGRFLYEGKAMVSKVTGSACARKGEKKVLVSEYGGKTSVKENLQYSRLKHPQAQAHWYDSAKEKDCKKWVKQAKQTAGGGRRG